MECNNCLKIIEIPKGYYHCSNCLTHFHGDQDVRACLDKFDTLQELTTKVVSHTGLGRIFSERFGIKDMEKEKLSTQMELNTKVLERKVK